MRSVQYQYEGDIIPPMPTFKKVFMGLHGLQNIFQKGCQIFIWFDDCHLNGPYDGVLLAIVSFHGNTSFIHLLLQS